MQTAIQTDYGIQTVSIGNNKGKMLIREWLIHDSRI